MYRAANGSNLVFRQERRRRRRLERGREGEGIHLAKGGCCYAVVSMYEYVHNQGMQAGRTALIEHAHHLTWKAQKLAMLLNYFVVYKFDKFF